MASQLQLKTHFLTPRLGNITKARCATGLFCNTNRFCVSDCQSSSEKGGFGSAGQCGIPPCCVELDPGPPQKPPKHITVKGGAPRCFYVLGESRRSKALLYSER